MEFNITGAPQTANANQQVAEFWAQAERLRMALLAIKPEAARAINRIAFLSEFSDIIDVALRAPDPQPVTDSLEVQEAVALPATAEREALNRIARIGVHRGMDCDEAVERLIADAGGTASTPAVSRARAVQRVEAGSQPDSRLKANHRHLPHVL